jgi:hypothetical protein
MFRALLAHPQEAFHKRHFAYYVRVMSDGYTRIKVEPVPLYSWCSQVQYFLRKIQATNRGTNLITPTVSPRMDLLGTTR